MSGAGYGGMTSAALDANMQFATALQGRFSALRNGAAAAQAVLPPALGFSNDHRLEFAAGLPATMAYAAIPGGDSPTAAAGWTTMGAGRRLDRERRRRRQRTELDERRRGVRRR